MAAMGVGGQESEIGCKLGPRVHAPHSTSVSGWTVIPVGSPHPAHFQKGNKTWTSSVELLNSLKELAHVLKQVRQGLPNTLEMSSIMP